jgi:signal transduction histidine kinase
VVPVEDADARAGLLGAMAADIDALIRKQESLLAFIEAISSELELRPLLSRILRYACELIGADNGTIGLVDNERDVVRTEALYNMPASEMGAEMPAGVGLAGEVLARGGPVVLARYGDVERPTQLGLLENAVIGMPIAARGRMIGFFGIGASASHDAGGTLQRPSPFTPEEVATLAIFARHAAVAIENARRYTREQERTERLALIARIGQIITADLRLADLLERAADAIHELLGYPNVAIALVESGDPPILVLRTVGGHYKDIVKGEYRIPVDRGIMGAAVRERCSQLVNDVASDPRHLPTPGAVGITAELALPILLGERVLGVLNVESGEPFSEEDAASLQIIADQLAVAIENARLYERAQRVAVLEERQRLARDLHDSVTQHIFGMVLIGESLGTAWRRDPTEGENRVTRLVDLSRAALAEMRALLAELRPDSEELAASTERSGLGRLRRTGLAASLASLARELAAESPRVSVDATDYRPQPLQTEEALYRIAQEALNNVMKHAAAEHASITVRTTNGETVLEITDNGVGFRSGRRKLERRGAALSGGLGLSTMRERAEERGGTLRLDSVPGQGTRVVVQIPEEGGKK